MSGLDEQAFGGATAFLNSMKRPLLISHGKPDGDALGSLVALRAMLESNGVRALSLLFDEIPHRYALFDSYEPMPVWGNDLAEDGLEQCDGVVILDTCTYNQLKPIVDWLRNSKLPKLAVDHHVTRDDLADHYLIDQSAAATCLILYEWAQHAGWSIPAEAREALFVGIAMDTGWFVHSNTDSRVLAAAAELTASGVKAHQIHQALYHRESPARIRLFGAALGRLELLSCDRLAIITLSRTDFEAVGASPADTEDIVNEPLRIESVGVSILLVDQGEGPIRASFRSKPPPPRLADSAGGSNLDVDVACVAQRFGGGGHSRAAGARIPGTLDEVRKAIVEHFQGILPS